MLLTWPEGQLSINKTHENDLINFRHLYFTVHCMRQNGDIMDNANSDIM